MAGENSYRQILKSSSVIGGASLINMVIGMARTKALALLLGPDGVGLIGAFGNITGIVVNTTGLGLSGSGAKDIAAAVGRQDPRYISLIVQSLRLTVFWSGAAGLAITLLLSPCFSRWTFGNSQYTWEIAALGLFVLFTAITTGMSATLQGFRRINDIANINITSSFLSTIISIFCYWFWGMKGVAASLIGSALVQLLLSWYFTRKIAVPSLPATFSEKREAIRNLLYFGFFFMLSNLVTQIGMYLITILMVRHFGLAERGIYQAAYSLSGLLINFILTSMATDYYPRLCGLAAEPSCMEKILNEQSEINILLALPGLFGIVFFAPIGIWLFYSSGFMAAIPLIQIFCVGLLFRLLSWPLGFVYLAQGKGKTFFAIESASCVLNVGLTYLGLLMYGIVGAAIGFSLFYLVYWLLLLGLLHFYQNINLHGSILKHFAIIIPGIIGFALARWLLPPGGILFYLCGIVICCGIGVYSSLSLCRCSNFKFHAILQKIRFRTILPQKLHKR